MTLIQILPWAVFGAFACIAWFVINIFASRTTRASERLDEIRDPRLRQKESALVRTGSGNSVTDAFEKAAPALSKALQPKTELEQNAMKIRLANAGFNSSHAPSVYLAIQFICLIIGCMAGAGIGLAKYGVQSKSLYGVILGGGTGFYLPVVILGFLRSARVKRIFLTLPDALDLLVVCVEAGLGLDAGLRRVTDELKDTAPDLTTEFGLCNFQLQMGRQRREVLHDLGVRSGVDDLKALAAILIQADRFGSSIAQALRVQSDSMRIKRSQMAEEMAQKTAVKLIFPLVLFIFPGIFVVLVGPAALMIINQLLKTNG
ncbi:MAG: type II secretion system F family protein [Planctomycetales bacterium]|nr:type II secretion system F family protein [Planctomycetales bacterium]